MTETQVEQLSGPRVYTLTGRNPSITYTYIPPGTRLPGTPHGGPGPVLENRLVYQGERGEKTFVEDELQIQNTPVGMQVTVILFSPRDTPTQVLTLLLPELRGHWGGPPSFTALARRWRGGGGRVCNTR